MLKVRERFANRSVELPEEGRKELLDRVLSTERRAGFARRSDGQARASEGAFFSIHSCARLTSKRSASSSVAKRASEIGRSMLRSPVGVACWMVETADHLPSFIRSAATAML